MIKCYIDGKLSDCDISDCNVCKKQQALIDENKSLTKYDIKILDRVIKLMEVLEIDHLGLVNDAVKKLVIKYNVITSSKCYQEIMRGD